MTLQDLINEYISGYSKTDNFKIIKKTFSNETINIPENFNYSTFRNSSLINIKLTNIDFSSSFFKEYINRKLYFR